MKKFIFKLEALLAARHAREGSLKREMEHAHQKWHQAKEQERMLLGQITTLREEIQQKRSSGCFELQETYAQILDNLQGALQQAQRSALQLQKGVMEQKERLKEAILERKVVEKIREKHYAEWRTREARSEGAFLDDFALKKFSEPK